MLGSGGKRGPGRARGLQARGVPGAGHPVSQSAWKWGVLDETGVQPGSMGEERYV